MGLLLAARSTPLPVIEVLYCSDVTCCALGWHCFAHIEPLCLTFGAGRPSCHARHVSVQVKSDDPLSDLHKAHFTGITCSPHPVLLCTLLAGVFDQARGAVKSDTDLQPRPEPEHRAPNGRLLGALHI
jgi:hypothetical protein